MIMGHTYSCDNSRLSSAAFLKNSRNSLVDSLNWVSLRKMV